MSKSEPKIKMELGIIEAFQQMSIESLSPANHANLEVIIEELKVNRGLVQPPPKPYVPYVPYDVPVSET